MSSSNRQFQLCWLSMFHYACQQGAELVVTDINSPGLQFMVKMAPKLFGWIAIKFGTDIHVLHRMYLTDFGNPLLKRCTPRI